MSEKNWTRIFIYDFIKKKQMFDLILEKNITVIMTLTNTFLDI